MSQNNGHKGNRLTSVVPVNHWHSHNTNLAAWSPGTAHVNRSSAHTQVPGVYPGSDFSLSTPHYSLFKQTQKAVPAFRDAPPRPNRSSGQQMVAIEAQDHAPERSGGGSVMASDDRP